MSDHYAMFCSSPNINKNLNCIEPIYFTDNSEKSLNAFKTCLSRSLISFNAFDSFDNNEKNESFLNLIYDLYKTNCKTLTKTLSVRRRAYPFMAARLLNSTNVKYRQYRLSEIIARTYKNFFCVIKNIT